MAQQVTCPACGKTNRPAAKFCTGCGAHISAMPTGTLATGSVLQNRYIVGNKIGKGGQGAVYQAADQRFSVKFWAIKEMSDTSLSTAERTQAIQDFQREANILAGLQHPNLPRVFDVFEQNGRWYLVMDFIDGETLEERLARTKAACHQEEVIDWALQLCDVLSYLHSQAPPIIFRDIKPSNIMLRKDGKIQLIDFGIARFFKTGQAKDTSLLGTIGFASPEQYGRSQTDARSDIYSLGVTMHHLLTLHDPAATFPNLPPLRAHNQALSIALEQVIKTATESDPLRRYQTAALMKQAIAQSNPTVTATPPLRKTPGQKPKPLWKYSLPGASDSTLCKLAPDGNTAVIHANRSTSFFDKTGQLTAQCQEDYARGAIAFSAESRFVATLDGVFNTEEPLCLALSLFDRGGTLRWKYQITESSSAPKSKLYTTAVALNALYACIGYKRDKQFMVQIVTGPTAGSDIRLPDPSADIRAMEVSTDTMSVAVSTNTTTCLIRANRIAWQYPFGSNALAISGDGARVYSGSSDYLMRCIEMASGRIIWQSDFGAMIKHLAASTTRSAIAMASGCQVQLIDGMGNAWTCDIGEPIIAMRIAHDGSSVIAASKKSLYQIAGLPGRVQWDAPLDFDIKDISLSPNGVIAAVGTNANDEVCYFRIP